MLNGHQKQMIENLQGKIHNYLHCFKSSLTLPEYKFIRDASIGILKSRSVTVNQIGMHLSEEITLKKTCERMYRQVRNERLTEKLRLGIIRKQSRQVDSQTLIIVDDSDIVKSRAKKMEGLKKVRDGSKGTYTDLGYDLMNIIAYKPEQAGYGFQVLPLSSDLISQSIETDSMSQLLEDRLTEVTINTGNKGVYLFDRYYDSRGMIGYLKENDNAFIIRSQGKRGLIVGDTEQSFLSVAKQIPITTRVSGSKAGSYFDCGLKRVKIRLNPYPKKHPETVDVWLVIARYKPNKNGKAGYFYFFCDFPNQQLTETEVVSKALNSYRHRWKIEQLHRQIKQDYKWEAIQLMSYTGLKNMNLLLLLSMCFLYSLKPIAIKLMKAFPRIMKYSNRKWKQIYDFIYYRIAEVIDVCFSYLSKYNKTTFKWLKKDLEQIYIAGL